MPLHEIIGFAFIFLGIIFYCFGLYGMTFKNNFYIRLSISSLIDSAGFITIMVGLMIYKGISPATLKLGLILLLMLLLNPLTNHILGRGAYLSHYSPEKEVN